MRKSVRNKLSLLAILLLACFLRIWDLDNESIWNDEAFSILVSKLNLIGLIEEVSSKDVNPPLYYIILHYWIALFGDSEFSVRFPSVIFGLFGMLAMYKVGTLLFNKDVGRIGSLLLALSVFHIEYSQEARSYSLMVLLTLLSFYFFFRLLREKSVTVSIGYIMSSILLLYTHNYALFIITSQNIYFLLTYVLSRGRNDLTFKRWMFFQFILFVLYLPWLVILIKQTFKVQEDFWIIEPGLKSIYNTFIIYSGSIILLFVFLILSCFSIITYERIKGKINWRDLLSSIEGYSWRLSLSSTDMICLLLVWLFTPIILPFILSKFSAPIYTFRYTIGASLAFYLLVAKGIENIKDVKIKSLVISLIAIFSLVGIVGYYTTINKQQWREATNFIEKTAKYDDLLLFYPGWEEKSFNYYSQRADLVKKYFPEELMNQNLTNEFVETVNNHKRFWLVISSRLVNHDSVSKDLEEKLISSYGLVSHMRYEKIDLYLFQKKLKIDTNLSRSSY